MYRFIAVVLASVLLAGCAAREVTGLSEPAPEATTKTVFFATQRNLE